MTTGHEKGLWAEKKAEIALILKGYRILARRYKTPLGEIDLVIRKGNVLAFVEVKARGSILEATEAIHAKNQGRVRQAAELYLQKHPEYTQDDIRFDAMLLAPGLWPQHMPDAWQ